MSHERDESSSAVPDPEQAVRTCPVCARPLVERACKLVCTSQGCGYFLSCADYY
jgi:ribosomal protein L37AE/L43A